MPGLAGTECVCGQGRNWPGVLFMKPECISEKTRGMDVLPWWIVCCVISQIWRLEVVNEVVYITFRKHDRGWADVLK